MSQKALRSHFRWIGLMHRDGKVAKALINARLASARAPEVGMPHLLSTHTVVLYRYLKTHGATIGLNINTRADVQAIAVAPPKSPAFIKGKSNRDIAAAFEQSLPWANVVETGGFGHVAWHSKDVILWPHGHMAMQSVSHSPPIMRLRKKPRRCAKSWLLSIRPDKTLKRLAKRVGVSKPRLTADKHKLFKTHGS